MAELVEAALDVCQALRSLLGEGRCERALQLRLLLGKRLSHSLPLVLLMLTIGGKSLLKWLLGELQLREPGEGALRFRPVALRHLGE